MNNNNISFYGSTDGAVAFITSSIQAATEVIEHYDFVINDISSSISDISLEKSKGSTIVFLKKMRTHWSEFKETLQADLDHLQKGDKEAK